MRVDKPGEFVADPLLHLGRMGEDSRARVDAAAEHAFPQLVGVAHQLDERDGVDPNVGEARAFN
jgi:hypothetical protein